MRLVHNVCGESSVLGLAVKGKLVFRLAVGNLVDLRIENIEYVEFCLVSLSSTNLEPLDGRLQQTRKHLLDISNVVQLISQRIGHVDRDHLPVGFALIDQRYRSQDLHLDNFATFCHPVANFQHINGIVVTLAAGRRVQVLGVLPRLRQRTVVPDVAVVWEAVGDEAQLALFHVLLNRVQRVG